MANPFLVIGLILSAASIAYNVAQARRLRKEARRRADEAAGIEVRVTSSGRPVPVAVGYCAAPGQLVYAQTSPFLTASPATVTDTDGDGSPDRVNLAFGALWAGRPTATGRGKFREYLLAQYVLCASGVQRLVDLYVDELPWDAGIPEGETVRPGDYLPPASSMAHRFVQGEAGAEATAFTDERDGNSRGVGYGRLDSFYRYNPDNPLFYGIPRVLGFLQGQQCRFLSRGGGAARFLPRGFTNASPLVLLEYMTDDTWGLARPDAEFDLDAWLDAYGVGQDLRWAPAGLWDQAYPQSLNDLGGSSHATWGAYFQSLGFRDITDTGLDAWHRTAVRSLNRYECNGLLKRPGDKLETLLAILACMPGAMLFRSLAGTWKLSAPPTAVNTGQTAAQASVGTVDEHLILERPSKAWPNTSDRLNSLTIKFNNLLKDFAQDSVTWPPPGSTAEQTLKDEDGGLVLADEFEIELAATPYHAMDIAHEMVMTSRRPRYVVRGRPLLAIYEPGDVVKLDAPGYGFRDEYVRLSAATLTPARSGRLSGEIQGIEYVPTDYAAVFSPRARLSLIPKPDYAAPVVDSVTAVITAQAIRQLIVTWEVAEGNNDLARDYLVEYAEFDAMPTAETTRNWRTIAHVAEGQDKRVAQTITETQRWYIARVTPRSVNDVYGQPVESAVVSAVTVGVGEQGPPGVGVSNMSRDPNTGVVTVDYTDGDADTFTVPDGDPGEDGRPGTDGADGEDGRGWEYIFTSSVTGAVITGSINLPDPDWNFDIPALRTGVTRGAYRYFDGSPPDLNSTRPWRIRFRRPVPGTPAQDAEIGSIPWLQDPAVRMVGEPGTPGNPASRGPTRFAVEVTFSEQTTLQGFADTPGTRLTDAGLRTKAHQAASGEPPGDALDTVDGDIVTFYRGEWAQAWVWQAADGNWRRLAKFLGAEVGYFGSLTAIDLRVTNAEVVETLTANKLTADVQNYRVLSTSPVGVVSGSTGVPATVNDDIATYDYLLLDFGSIVDGKALLRSVLVPLFTTLFSSYSAYERSGSSYWYETGIPGGRFRVWRVSATQIRLSTESGSVSLLQIGGIRNPVVSTGARTQNPAASGTRPTNNVSIDSFSADSISIQSGGSTTLRWATSHATGVSINQGIGTVAVDGSVTVSPTATTIYTLTAMGPGGPVTEQVTVTVTVAGQAPGTPTTPTVVSRTMTSLRLRTTAGTGGTPTVFRWRVSTNSAVTDNDPKVTSTGPEVTIIGLSAGTDYWIDVRGENAAGNSSYSDDLATETAASTPPVARPAAFSRTTTQRVSTNSGTLGVGATYISGTNGVPAAWGGGELRNFFAVSGSAGVHDRNLNIPSQYLPVSVTITILDSGGNSRVMSGTSNSSTLTSIAISTADFNWLRANLAVGENIAVRVEIS